MKISSNLKIENIVYFQEFINIREHIINNSNYYPPSNVYWKDLIKDLSNFVNENLTIKRMCSFILSCNILIDKLFEREVIENCNHFDRLLNACKLYDKVKLIIKKDPNVTMWKRNKNKVKYGCRNYLYMYIPVFDDYLYVINDSNKNLFENFESGPRLHRFYSGSSRNILSYFDYDEKQIDTILYKLNSNFIEDFEKVVR